MPPIWVVISSLLKSPGRQRKSRSGGRWLYPYHQNVLWTFLIAIVCMLGIDKIKSSSRNIAVKILLILLIVFGGWLTGTITFVDYYGFGVLTVLTFYAFHKKDGGIIWPR
ncbi:hypothetical protein B5F28_02580 [Gemmiger sp. An194]|nr:hypothetical protein B5F28_02580 [Gemmiger sp. An194]